MDFTEIKLPPNPAEKTNIFSKMFFLWIVPLFKKGYKKDLETEDLYDIQKVDQTERLGNRLEKLWEKELERAKDAGETASLSRTLMMFSWKPFIWITAVFTFYMTVIVVSHPVFLRLFIVALSDSNSGIWERLAYAGALSLSVFLNTLTNHPMTFIIMHFGMQLRVAISSMIYRKALRLSSTAQQKTSSGQIVNLLSNDCMRFDICLNYFPYFVCAPLFFVIMMYLLYDQIGLSSTIGAAVLISLIPFQYYIGKYTGIFRLAIAKKADERGRLMNEIIGGMRVIKQYAWEKPFSILIKGIRRAEVGEVRSKGIIRGIYSAMINFVPKVVQYLTFVTYALIVDEPMRVDRVYFTMACINSLMHIAVHYMPLATAGVGEMMVSIRRIQDFLLLEEQKPNNLLLYNAPGITSGDEMGNGKGMQKWKYESRPLARISMQNASASWTDERKALDDVTFSIGEGKLVIVVGPVGSSKSSLLHAIVDELPISSGTMSVNGTTAYASQEPWIFAGNIRQNILLGLPYDEQRYRKTIKACALQEDMKQLPYGDMTIVGERGVALSGGQKARVNLARALYRKADIYLMDDPLSAVDIKVSRQLFKKCIQEYLKGSTRILVTHQLQYMQQADHIIVLDNGKIAAQGTFEELAVQGVDFDGLMAAGEEAVAKRLSLVSRPSHMSHSSVGSRYSEYQQLLNELEESREKPKENVESKTGGSVTGKTYFDYFLSGHSILGFFGLVVSFLVAQVFVSGIDGWLAFWSNAERRNADLQNNVIMCDQPGDSNCENTYLGRNIYLYVYTGLAVGVTVACLIRSIWFFVYSCSSSVNIHNKMFSSLVRAPIKFFDDNPSGRIMNRFTKDVGAMDELLPPAFFEAASSLLQAVGVLVVVVISNYFFSVPTLLMLISTYFIRKVYVETARDIKRIESVTKSPVFTHVVATLQGLTTIRACGAQNILVQQFEGHQDIHSSVWFLFLGATRGFGLWAELICAVFLTTVAFSSLFITSSEDGGGSVGLAIASVLTLMGTFQWGLRQSAETETYMTSVERCLEYSKLEPEAELKSRKDRAPPLVWPTLGQIEFRDLSLSYEVDKPVLKNLNFKIKPAEKIGIVGRTGAGKSSIISALFRLTEPNGSIYIDGIRVNNIGLHDLRKNISIIPQEPILFSGSVRYNLDPFSKFNDIDLWRVIEEVKLKEVVSSLDYEVADGGTNFSVGQRQLFCLARALLRKNKILVLDEATANVDYSTDYFIQDTIRTKFSECTIITIAHRLQSIIDCDRILVLDHGVLREYDHPHILLQKKGGIFAGMVNQTGFSTSVTLKKLAHEAYKKKHHRHTLGSISIL